MSLDQLRVPPEKLNTRCDADLLELETTEDIDPLAETIGQDRAMSALELALNLDAPGFNIYVSGQAGSGRNTALRTHLELAARSRPIPPDWGYAYNFDDPGQPMALVLACGMMKQLAKDLHDLVDLFRRDIPQAFEGTEYVHSLEEVMTHISQMSPHKCVVIR